jgi:hypothetical protein
MAALLRLRGLVAAQSAAGPGTTLGRAAVSSIFGTQEAQVIFWLLLGLQNTERSYLVVFRTLFVESALLSGHSSIALSVN